MKKPIVEEYFNSRGTFILQNNEDTDTESGSERQTLRIRLARKASFIATIVLLGNSREREREKPKVQSRATLFRYIDDASIGSIFPLASTYGA